MELTVEKIQECRVIKELLDNVCEKYFEAHAPEWESYAGWKFSDDYPNYVIIHYTYYDWRDQYESGIQAIPMGVLVEFSKTLNK